MSQPTKLKRRYNATRRRAQANETRQQIIEAARLLFTTQGYSGATIDAIALEAGVSPETVYAVFGNKRNILTSLVDFLVGGDSLPMPLLERTGPQAVLDETDPERALQLFARDITSILERIAPVFEIIRMAAKTEPEIADLLQNMLAQRLKNISRLASRLGSLGALREGMDETRAAETIWALSSPELFRLLQVDRGWSKDAYIHWLSEVLIRVVLA